jgi:uncharacterized protein (DUF58 family)
MKKKLLGDLYMHVRWYFAAGGTALLFLLSFFLPIFWPIAVIYSLLLVTITIADYLMLFWGSQSLLAHRIVPERFSLGDENTVDISLLNLYSFPVDIMFIDEVPQQFQYRNFKRYCHIAAGKRVLESYTLRPLTRGEYFFGNILCYASSPLRLLQRRHIFSAEQMVKTYPSTRMLRRYQLLALSDNTFFAGARKTRRLGHSLEFEQIREYVQGDDMRTVNWKATARKNSLMVNSYMDAKSQLIYCMIDKGRAMKMPFENMTLLDHSINAALIFLNVALLKQDKAGLVTFSTDIDNIVPAERHPLQMSKIIDVLYKQRTNFVESNYEVLTTWAHRKISQRSFLLFFTNFETMAALERQLPYLRRLAARHLLCVVFFENTLLKEIHDSHPDTLEGIYIKTIADRFSFEKKQIVRELRRHGILSVLTTPGNLTIDIVNKYLELKSRQMV